MYCMSVSDLLHWHLVGTQPSHSWGVNPVDVHGFCLRLDKSDFDSSCFCCVVGVAVGGLVVAAVAGGLGVSVVAVVVAVAAAAVVAIV